MINTDAQFDIIRRVLRDTITQVAAQDTASLHKCIICLALLNGNLNITSSQMDSLLAKLPSDTRTELNI